MCPLLLDAHPGSTQCFKQPQPSLQKFLFYLQAPTVQVFSEISGQVEFKALKGKKEGKPLIVKEILVQDSMHRD